MCGIARLAPRSLAATATFMASGVATATLAGSLAAMGVDPSAATTLQLMAPQQLSAALPLLGGGAAAAAGLFGLGRLAAPASRPALALAAEFGTGAMFAVGLALSGMVQPSKVAG